MWWDKLRQSLVCLAATSVSSGVCQTERLDEGGQLLLSLPPAPVARACCQRFSKRVRQRRNSRWDLVDWSPQVVGGNMTSVSFLQAVSLPGNQITRLQSEGEKKQQQKTAPLGLYKAVLLWSQRLFVGTNSTLLYAIEVCQGRRRLLHESCLGQVLKKPYLLQNTSVQLWPIYKWWGFVFFLI